MQLLFVTSNSHKFEEMSAVLKEFGIRLARAEMDFVEHSHKSLEEISLDKALQAFEKFQEPLIVEDTGLFFEAFENFPGTEPKRAFENLGYEGILKMLEGKNRKAFFKTVICYIESLNVHNFFEAEWHGQISKKVAMPDKKGLPYNRIFIPNGLEKTAIELPEKEKNKICQRGIAARKLGKWLKEGQPLPHK